MEQDSSALRLGLHCLLDTSALVPMCLDSSDAPNQFRSIQSPNYLRSEVSGYR